MLNGSDNSAAEVVRVLRSCAPLKRFSLRGSVMEGCSKCGWRVMEAGLLGCVCSGTDPLLDAIRKQTELTSLDLTVRSEGYFDVSLCQCCDMLQAVSGLHHLSLP